MGESFDKLRMVSEVEPLTPPVRFAKGATGRVNTLCSWLETGYGDSKDPQGQYPCDRE